MVANTEQVAAQPAPEAPQPPAVKTLTVEQANEQAGRVAAATRKQTEAELTAAWQAKLDSAVAERDQELEQLRAAEKARAEAELSALEVAEKRAKEAEGRAQAAAEQVKQLAAERQAAERRGEIAALIAGSNVRVPPRYHADVYAALMAAPDLGQQAADEQLTAAHEAWQADIAAYSPPTAPQTSPPARNVGAALSPPATVQPTAPSEQERDAAIRELIARMQAGDAEAGAALDREFGPTPIKLG